MPRATLSEVFEGLPRPRVMVLGDMMVDQYTWGDADRISQEAPILVLRACEQQTLLGGAANVCNMLRGLQCEVACAGVVGDDEAGRTGRGMLQDRGVECRLLLTDPQRPTTVKERFVGRRGSRHANQILRVDHEFTGPLEATLAATLIEQLAEQLPAFNALLISDYDKGVCEPTVLRAVIDTATACGVPVLVDPRRGGDFERYRGATLLKPNRSETAAALERETISTDDVLQAGMELCQRLGVRMVVITLDRDGIALIQQDGARELFPTAARSVYDITGAGDMVLAMLGACLGGGATAAQAVQLANVAAGLEVERFGVAVIERDEILAQLTKLEHPATGKILTQEQAAAQADHHRQQGRRIVFTNGCFDLLHVGHVTSLQEAASHGDVLYVGINSDAGIRRLKGEGRPVINQHDRAAVLAALGCVSHVVIFDEDTPHALLHAIRPDVLVKGGTYAPQEVTGHEVVEAYGGQVRVTRVVQGISTTRIVEWLTQQHQSRAA